MPFAAHGDLRTRTSVAAQPHHLGPPSLPSCDRPFIHGWQASSGSRWHHRRCPARRMPPGGQIWQLTAPSSGNALSADAKWAPKPCSEGAYRDVKPPGERHANRVLFNYLGFIGLERGLTLYGAVCLFHPIHRFYKRLQTKWSIAYAESKFPEILTQIMPWSAAQLGRDPCCTTASARLLYCRALSRQPKPR